MGFKQKIINLFGAINVKVENLYPLQCICIKEFDFPTVFPANSKVTQDKITVNTKKLYNTYSIDNGTFYDIYGIGVIYEATFKEHFIHDKSPERLKNLKKII